jgi:hypothetical protein
MPCQVDMRRQPQERRQMASSRWWDFSTFRRNSKPDVKFSQPGDHCGNCGASVAGTQAPFAFVRGPSHEQWRVLRESRHADWRCSIATRAVFPLPLGEKGRGKVSCALSRACTGRNPTALFLAAKRYLTFFLLTFSPPRNCLRRAVRAGLKRIVAPLQGSGVDGGLADPGR